MNRNDIFKVFYYTMSNWSLMSSAQKNLIENDEYTPPPDSDWVRMTIGYGDEFDGELGELGCSIEGGITFIDLFIVKDKGDTAGNIYAESLRSLFRRKDITYTEGSVIYSVFCKSVDIEPLGIDGDYARIQVRANFDNIVS